MTRPITPLTGGCDEEYVMPTVDALMAGTLALMTGYAQADPAGGQRRLLAHKLVSNLLLLSEHPQISPSLRCMLTRPRARWQIEHEQAASAQRVPEPTSLWHAAPGVVQ